MSHFTRRHFLHAASLWAGRPGAGLAAGAGRDCRPRQPAPQSSGRRSTFVPRRRRTPPQATAMISMFMQGGPSHVDLFDPKPELTKRIGRSSRATSSTTTRPRPARSCSAAPGSSRKHGQCGMELSELLPHLGDVADDICLIRSMHTGVNNHGQSINALNTGESLPAGRRSDRGSPTAWGPRARTCRPSSCLTDPGGLPVVGVDNWSNGWLPSLYQGTVVRPQEPRILNLDPPPQLRRASAAATALAISTAQPRASGESSRRTGPGPPASPATSWPRGCRPPPRKRSISPRKSPRRTSSTASTTPDTRIRHALPDRPPAGRARRAVRADLHRQSDLGPSQRHRKVAARHLPEDRSARGRAGARPEAARPARHDARPLGRRDGPAAGHSERKEHRPRPQHLRLQHVARRRRRSRAATSTARPTSSATRPSRTSSPTTTTTPRCCTSSASTNSSLVPPPHGRGSLSTAKVVRSSPRSSNLMCGSGRHDDRSRGISRIVRWPNSLVLARRTNLTAENESASKYGPWNHPLSEKACEVHKWLVCRRVFAARTAV